MRRRDILAAALIAGVVSAVLALPTFDRLRGVSIDVLFWLRHLAYGQQYTTESSPAVIVALDEESYRTPPFAEKPVVLWTPQIAAVLNAVVAGGAKVVGFDMILPQSVESVARGYDRDFLVALRNAAREGKVVLGKVQHQLLPIRPFPGQSFAVGHQQNIRSSNLFRDDDEVIRSVPLTFQSDDLEAGQRTETSMAAELALRALGAKLEPAHGGRLQLAGHVLPGSDTNNIHLNFDGGGRAIPLYSFADLYACADGGHTDYFKRQFDGKIVLFGTVLDVEDRKLSSMRYMTGPEGVINVPRCTLPPMEGLHRADLFRDTIPGVIIQATAVNNLVRGDSLWSLDPTVDWSIDAVLALGAACLTLLFAPVMAGAAIVAGALAWTAVATVALRESLVLPLLDPLLGATVTFGLVLGYRFIIADRDKRLLRQSFGLYLAPSVVDQLVETRDVTVWFSDVEGFTAISESLPPGDLVALMNEYLTAMTDIVEAHGGFVDKYIGDAIVAVFGAPHDDKHHALNAVRAALACQARLAELNRDNASFKGHRLACRIGINSGQTLVGNIGSRRRFNYTVMGDAVNLASRLEGANKMYGTRILASAATAERTGTAIVWREIDRVRVKGREQPVVMFEPVAEKATISAAAADRTEVYERALAAYRARKFDAAAAGFEGLADDAPAQIFLTRARAYATAEPPDEWDGVVTLETK
jgi:class 3 adenylate cyclase/CHASE2 domain-containing sensor protein